MRVAQRSEEWRIDELFPYMRRYTSKLTPPKKSAEVSDGANFAKTPMQSKFCFFEPEVILFIPENDASEAGK